jgi:ornithine decarboxylase
LHYQRTHLSLESNSTIADLSLFLASPTVTFIESSATAVSEPIEQNNRLMSQTQVLQPAPSITLLYDNDTQTKSEESYIQEARLSLLASEIRNARLSDPPSAPASPDEEWDGVDNPIEISEELPSLHEGPIDYHKFAGIRKAQEAAIAHVPDGERAFFVADLSRVYLQFQRWTRCLPGIKPFYGEDLCVTIAFHIGNHPITAVKCNPDPFVLRLLAALGTGFDCASLGEISQVLGMGSIDPSRIIFANPCKALSFIRQSKQAGVDTMTFDNVDELVKIARIHPGAHLVLRILTDDSKSLCRLGLKFGASLHAVPTLLAKAQELHLNVIGISFHVGSGCYDPSAFADAVSLAKTAFNIGRDMGFSFRFLDVGGGFEDDNFERTAAVLRAALLAHFNEEIRAGLEIIAEPGRFFVSKAFELVTNIIARRVDETTHDSEEGAETRCRIMCRPCSPISHNGHTQTVSLDYINDGVYGAFNCILFDHQKVHPHVLTLRHTTVTNPIATNVGQLASVWGPTCDSIDCVCPDTTLPPSLEVGDWLGFENMGAYTICAASQFNGFERSGVIYTAGIGQSGSRVQALLREFGGTGN